MSQSAYPRLNLAIARLHIPEVNYFATWVLDAPQKRAYVHHDQSWPDELSEVWQAWLEMFSPHLINLMPIPTHSTQELNLPNTETSGKQPSYSSRLMQHLGISLWEWLFDGPIKTCFAESQGIAIGQNLPLRLQIDLREPELVYLPWEIMQPGAGVPAISLSQQILFSRTISNVNPLPPQSPAASLNILLVLGEQAVNHASLNLESEAIALKEALENKQVEYSPANNKNSHSQVTTLIQPTPAELINALETGQYNIFFYAGHGIPGPDGGLLFFAPETTINGTELGQALIQGGIKLAVFNACWGAQPAISQDISDNNNIENINLPVSSLAEVMINHGLPAVLGMRDVIADQEALSFIQTFTEALSEGNLIDQAVAIARQQLLTLYKFNSPTWTLPVLYMHPEYDGQLMQLVEEVVTQLPANSSGIGYSQTKAYLQSQNPEEKLIYPLMPGAITKVGRLPDNDVIVQEQWVSQKHAEIFSRHSHPEDQTTSTYYLRDFSRYGTLIALPEHHHNYSENETVWQRVHHQEIALTPGILLKFGSSQGQAFEFNLTA